MTNKFSLIFSILFLLAAILNPVTGCRTQDVNTPVTIGVDENNVINTIPKTMFGFNYWMWVPTYGEMTNGTEKLIAPLKVKLLRFGGINNDVDRPDPVDEEAINKFIDYCLAVGAEPVLQVPVARYKENEERLERAFQMIETVMKKTKLKYVSIGNEPDIYAQTLAADNNFNVPYLKGYGIDDYIKDFNTMAGAIKEKYRDIKIIGLDLSYKREWIPKFVKNCRDRLDYLSVHYYPFNASQSTYVNVKNNFKQTEDFYREIIQKIKNNAGEKLIPLIIGETNVSWEGNPEHANKDASLGTFSAGLWFADMIGISSEYKEIYSIMPWSIREGWMNGFLDADKNPRPVYYVYKMFSSMDLSQLILSKKVNDNLRIYGYTNRNKDIILYLVNWDKKNPQSIHFEFTGSSKNSELDYECGAWSLTCLRIRNGALKQVYVYSEKDKSEGVKEIE